MLRQLQGSLLGNRASNQNAGQGYGGRWHPILAEDVQVDGAHVIKAHDHACTQLLVTSQTIQIKTAQFTRLVPAGTATWIPAGMSHGIIANQSIRYTSLFIDSAIASMLWQHSLCIQSSTLLRSAMQRAAEFGEHYRSDSAESRLFQVILDELKRLPVDHFNLPLPTQPRLKQVCENLLQSQPTDIALTDVARLSCMSVRSVQRHFQSETGLAFQQWRQHWQVIRALEALHAGQTIKQTAAYLGYGSSSAFISMFKRVIGVTPGRYLQVMH